MRRPSTRRAFLQLLLTPLPNLLLRSFTSSLPPRLTHSTLPLLLLPSSGLVSGAPPELTARQVRIFRPGPSTMQSGKAGYNFWKLDFDVLGSGGRWINPLMGWASSCVLAFPCALSLLVRIRLGSDPTARHLLPPPPCFRSAPNRADYQQALSLKFNSQQSAVDFCTRQGWDYQVSKPNVQPFVPKAYAENFVHQPDKLRLLRTK